MFEKVMVTSARVVPADLAGMRLGLDVLDGYAVYLSHVLGLTIERLIYPIPVQRFISCRPQVLSSHRSGPHGGRCPEAHQSLAIPCSSLCGLVIH